MEPVTGLGEERFGHESRMIPMRVSEFFDEPSEGDHAVRSDQRFVKTDIDLNLAGGVFRVGLLNRYTDCGEMTTNRP